jgi:serine/threonine-protein kinase RsbW
MNDFRSREQPEALPRDGSRPPEILLFERIVPAVPESIGRIRRGLDESLTELDLGAGRRSDIALAVTEGVTNAVLHAYLDARPGPLYVAAGLSGASLSVTISDCGRGMVPRADSPGLGIGLSLIRRLADELTIGAADAGAGTTVTMLFHGLATAGAPRAIEPVRDADDLREYLHLLATAGALQADTRALIGEAEQAVATARRLRDARRRLH